MYSLKNLLRHENLLYLVTSTIEVFDFTIYALLEPRASLSFITAYVAMNFDIIPKKRTIKSFHTCLVNLLLKKEFIVIVPYPLVKRVPWPI